MLPDFTKHIWSHRSPDLKCMMSHQRHQCWKNQVPSPTATHTLGSFLHNLALTPFPTTSLLTPISLCFNHSRNETRNACHFLGQGTCLSTWCDDLSVYLTGHLLPLIWPGLLPGLFSSLVLTRMYCSTVTFLSNNLSKPQVSSLQVFHSFSSSFFK